MKQSRCIDSLKDVFTANPGLSRKAATIVLLLFAVLFAGNVLAQNPLYEKVKADYPSLTSIYGNRLEKQKAHYIFAIDVSTVMRDNIKTIKPMIKDFIEALPEGDLVTLIRESSTDSTKCIVGNQPVNASSRSMLVSKLYGKEFEVRNAGSDGYTMTRLVLKEIMDPRSEGPVFVFMFTDFSYWTGKKKKDEEDWGALRDEFKPFIELTDKGQNRVVLAYPIFFKGDETDDFRPELKEIFGTLETPPESEPILLKNFFDKMKANAMVYRLKYLVYQDLAKTKPTSSLSLSDNKEIMVTTQCATEDDNSIFNKYYCETSDEPQCLDKAFAKIPQSEINFDEPTAIYSINNNYKPLLPCIKTLGSKLHYSVKPLCAEYANELDRLNGFDATFKIDYAKPYEFEEELPSKTFFFHCLPLAVDIVIAAIALLLLVCWIVTLLINKFGKIYRTWNIMATTDDGEKEESYSHSFPKAKKVTVTPSALGIVDGGNWRFDIITEDGMICWLWKPRGYYIARGCAMTITRKGETKALPNKPYRVTTLKKWGSGCTLKFKSNDIEYTVRVQ